MASHHRPTAPSAERPSTPAVSHGCSTKSPTRARTAAQAGVGSVTRPLGVPARRAKGFTNGGTVNTHSGRRRGRGSRGSARRCLTPRRQRRLSPGPVATRARSGRGSGGRAVTYPWISSDRIGFSRTGYTADSARECHGFVSSPGEAAEFADSLLPPRIKEIQEWLSDSQSEPAGRGRLAGRCTSPVSLQ